MNFSPQQIASFVAAVRKEFGEGWRLLVPRLQIALITEKAFEICNGQDSEMIPTLHLGRLRIDMLFEAKLARDYLDHSHAATTANDPCRCGHVHVEHFNKLAKGIAKPCHAQVNGRRCDCPNYVPA